MTRNELIRAVLAEMERVWGGNGFGGEAEAYEWLKENYGVSEEDDIHWQDILNYYIGDLPDSIADLTGEDAAEVMAFVEDDGRVVRFLEGFLEQYRCSDATYPQKAEEDQSGNTSAYEGMS